MRNSIFASICLLAVAAAYAAPTTAPVGSIPRLPAAEKRDFCIYSSALSPFIVIRNNGPRTLLFQNMQSSGPTHVALVDDHKVKVFSTSQEIDPKDMSEAWILAWFDGGKGHEETDVPILIVLQHLPSAIKLAGSGIELTFPRSPGYIAMVPLHGSRPTKAAETAAWKSGLPDAVAARCRALTDISREYPIHVEERYKLFPQQDRAIIRDRFEFLSIDDDWKTGHRKIAPLDPVVAQAWKNKFRLLSVTGTVVDLDMPTQHGTFAGVEGDECSYTLTALLRYINNLEESSNSAIDAMAADLAARLRAYQQRASAIGWGSPLTVDDLVASIRIGRAAWRAHDEDAYRFASYLAAKQFMALWTMGKSLPKDSLNASELRRFARERMSITFDAAAEKTAPLWKSAELAAQPDATFRAGLGYAIGGAAQSPVLLVVTKDGAWPSLALPVGGAAIDLGTIRHDPSGLPVRPMSTSSFSLSTWACDFAER